MQLKNIRGFKTIEAFISWKLEKFSHEEKTFQALFHNMFLEEENVFAEISTGFRIQKMTYGQCRDAVLTKACALKPMLNVPQGTMIGLYMDNSIEWIEIFWALLMCGYTPLLMNVRLTDEMTEQILQTYDVPMVISDRKIFSVHTILADRIATCAAPDPDIDQGTWGDHVVFMTSGTSDEPVKLCFYTAENFYYQLGNSVDIVRKCPQIAAHYNGELKLLTLLPFYHVFGFIAVYLWFGFFSRTFVFLQDMNPNTIQNTIRKHQVTHVFAVPLVWNTVYKKALHTIADQGEKTYRKFQKGLRLANSSRLGRRAVYASMAEVRDKLFGDSIQFLISGGSFISKEALAFFNGIGYHLANGYGMTEVGITSVEIANQAKVRNLGSIGAPFTYTEYQISDDGELLIRGKNTASRILFSGQSMPTGYADWYHSGDLATVDKGRYYLKGRNDDLIVSKTGENLNPNLIESSLYIDGVDMLCLIHVDGEPVLLLSAPSCYTADRIRQLMDRAKAAIRGVHLHNEIYHIVVTSDRLLEENEFKLSRRKIARRFKENRYAILTEGDAAAACIEVHQSGLLQEIKALFGDILQKKPAEIDADAHFFSDLGGSSLDYFMLADAIQEKFGVDIKDVQGDGLCTVNQIYLYIKSK